MSSKIFAIGDIHGCFDEMMEMLDIIEPKANHSDDKIVFLGDYIDRGPKSKEVIDQLISLHEKNSDRYVFLMGNHEDMFNETAYYGGYSTWFSNGGHETLKSYNYNPVEHPGIHEAIPPKHKHFMSNLGLYYKRNRVVCVHAGLDPTLRLDQHDTHTMLWNRKFTGYKGDYLDNMFVVYGHTPVERIIQRENQLGIDTGCVFGNYLTCVEINDISGNVNEIYRVESKQPKVF